MVQRKLCGTIHFMVQQTLLYNTNSVVQHTVVQHLPMDMIDIRT
jgi:hypothetical protein